MLVWSCGLLGVTEAPQAPPRCVLSFLVVFGHKQRSFRRAPPDLAPPPRGATGEFLAQNLDSARPPPRVCDG